MSNWFDSLGVQPAQINHGDGVDSQSQTQVSAPGQRPFPTDAALFWNQFSRSDVLCRSFLFDWNTGVPEPDGDTLFGNVTNPDDPAQGDAPARFVPVGETRVSQILSAGLGPTRPGDPNSPIGFAQGPDGMPNDNGSWALAVLTQMPASELRKLTQRDLNAVISFPGGRNVTFFELLQQFSPSSVKLLDSTVLSQTYAPGGKPGTTSFADEHARFVAAYAADHQGRPPRDWLDRPAGDPVSAPPEFTALAETFVSADVRGAPIVAMQSNGQNYALASDVDAVYLQRTSHGPVYWSGAGEELNLYQDAASGNYYFRRPDGTGNQVWFTRRQAD